MARRNGRKGDYLAVSDYTGFTHYGSELTLDYWGNAVARPLKRNLQEIATPLNDPRPVSLFRGPNYEISAPGLGTFEPDYVGTTTSPTNKMSLANQVLGLDLSIPNMTVGTTFVVR